MRQCDARSWAATGVKFDVFEDAQERFHAEAWTKRREKNDADGASSHSPCTFSKLDFLALAIDKQLTTKTQVLAYVQDFGTASMQAFCSKNQRRLKEFS